MDERAMAPPTIRDETKIDLIIEQLEEGKSLTAICQAEGMPTRRTVQRWMQGDDELAVRLLEAREVGFFQFAEETLELVENEPDPNKARVILASRQWFLGKLSNAFREKPVQIGVQVNGAAGDAFEAITGALNRAADAIAGGGTSTQLLVDEGEAGSDPASG